jgi:O-antigen/teichoic acid export membrane protein
MSSSKILKNIIFPDTKHRILHEGVWVTVGQLASAIGVLIGIRLLTEYIPPVVFGFVNLLIGISTLLYGLLCSPILQAVLRYYPEEVKKNKIQVLRYSITTLLQQNTLLLTGIILIAGSIYAVLTHTSCWIYVLLAGLSVVEVKRGLETNFITAARRQRPYALWNIAEAWLRPACAIVFVMLYGATPQNILLGYFAASFTILVLGLTLTEREGIAGQSSIRERDIILEKEIHKYAMPLIPLAFVGWISGLSDRYIIGGLRGLEQVGIYAATYGLISRPFLIAGVIIELTLRPIYFDAISTGQDIRARKIFNVWLGVTTVICAVGVIAVILLREHIGVLLLAKNYRSSVNLMPWVALGYSLLVISNVFEKPSYAYKKTKAVLYIWISGAVASILIGIPLVYYWGLQGAAVAIPIYFGIQLLYSMYLAKQVRK